jgi:hypothetical protein
LVGGIDAEAQAGLDEFRQLREEKAADWRLITQSTIATLATAAAIVAAGLSIKSYLVVVAAPLPFYCGVLFMIQSARLQGRLIAFLATHKPPGALDYEGKVIKARNAVKEDHARKLLFPRWVQSWDWWRAVATLVGVLVALFPYTAAELDPIKGFPDSPAFAYTAVGISLAGAFFCVSRSWSKKAGEGREAWARYWRDHRESS